MSTYISKDPFLIIKDHFVFKPDHVYAEPFDEQPPFTIALDAPGGEMSGTVELDGEPFRWTVKIKDVWPDTVLTTKFSTIEIRILKDRPHACLGRRQPFAKLGAECLERGKSVNVSFASRERHVEGEVTREPLGWAKDAWEGELEPTAGNFRENHPVSQKTAATPPS